MVTKGLSHTVSSWSTDNYFNYLLQFLCTHYTQNLSSKTTVYILFTYKRQQGAFNNSIYALNCQFLLTTLQ